MKKENIKRVALFVCSCLIVGVFINYVIVMNIFDLQGFLYIVLTAMTIVICGLVIFLLTFLIMKTGKQKAGYNSEKYASNDSDNDRLGRLTVQIDKDLIKIRQLNDYIENEYISGELTEIEKNIRKIQAQIKEGTAGIKGINQLEEFFEYYVPLIVKILNSYRRIETNELTGKNADETKKQVSAVLPLIKKAFEKELDYMFTDEMLDITTDIKVLEAMLQKDGLTDKNNEI